MVHLFYLNKGFAQQICQSKGGPPLGANEVGEVAVRTSQMFDGYLNRPEATEQAFDEFGWFYTGNLQIKSTITVI